MVLLYYNKNNKTGTYGVWGAHHLQTDGEVLPENAQCFQDATHRIHLQK